MQSGQEVGDEAASEVMTGTLDITELQVDDGAVAALLAMQGAASICDDADVLQLQASLLDSSAPTCCPIIAPSPTTTMPSINPTTPAMAPYIPYIEYCPCCITCYSVGLEVG